MKAKGIKIGNMLYGVLKLIDGIIIIILLGNYISNLSVRWNLYRKCITIKNKK